MATMMHPTERRVRRRTARCPAPVTAPVRRALVERIRREIRAGAYCTPARLDAALDRLIAVRFLRIADSR